MFSWKEKLLHCVFRTPTLLLQSSYPAPSQLLPSSCPLSALLYSTQLSSCPVPALLLTCSCFCPASLHHHLTTFFGTARAAFYRRFYCWYAFCFVRVFGFVVIVVFALVLVVLFNSLDYLSRMVFLSPFFLDCSFRGWLKSLISFHFAHCKSP